MTKKKRKASERCPKRPHEKTFSSSVLVVSVAIISNSIITDL